MEVKIQLAKPKDIPTIKELIEYANLSSNLERCRYTFKAVLEKQVVGTISMEYHGRYAVLRALVVREGFRRRGIGSALVWHCIAVARKDGILGIYGLTEFRNITFFGSFGFKLKRKCGGLPQGLPEEIQDAWQPVFEKYKGFLALGLDLKEEKMTDPVEETIRCYEATAEDYAQGHLDPEVMRPQLEFFSENLQGKSILDVGCGPGRDAKYFTDRGFGVIGIDPVGGFLEIAKEVAPKATFLKMDMRALGFADCSFDGLWACASLLHIPKEEVLATLQGFRLILKPNGFLYLCVKEGEGEGWLNYGEGRRSFIAFYRLEELQRLVEEAGFEIVKIYLDHKHAVFIDVFARRGKGR